MLLVHLFTPQTTANGGVHDYHAVLQGSMRVCTRLCTPIVGREGFIAFSFPIK